MKKMIMIILTLFTVMSLTTMAFAGASTAQSSAGGNVVIPGASATCSGPDLTFTPSPGTWMAVFTTNIAFSAAAVSSKTTIATGIEYGVYSASNAVYQRVQTAASDTAIPSGMVPSTVFLPGSDWKDKSGNAATGS